MVAVRARALFTYPDIEVLSMFFSEKGFELDVDNVLVNYLLDASGFGLWHFRLKSEFAARYFGGSRFVTGNTRSSSKASEFRYVCIAALLAWADQPLGSCADLSLNFTRL